jgi:hypothetical protein
MDETERTRARHHLKQARYLLYQLTRQRILEKSTRAGKVAQSEWAAAWVPTLPDITLVRKTYACEEYESLAKKRIKKLAAPLLQEYIKRDDLGVDARRIIG